jgi:hypothetical protein
VDRTVTVPKFSLSPSQDRSTSTPEIISASSSPPSVPSIPRRTAMRRSVTTICAIENVMEEPTSEMAVARRRPMATKVLIVSA